MKFYTIFYNLFIHVSFKITSLLILFAPGGAQGCNQGPPVTPVFSDTLNFTPGLSSDFELSGQSSPSFLWSSSLAFPV